ncbi:hypothetical protein HYR69_06745, partial [Candidatus Sumerlaeota bacterium]|nr:hypothetical protein [Candidatus Sumerlaeota bacterium]
MSSIFRDLLGVEAAGRNDDFFELGGTSLKLAGLQIELKRSFGQEAPLADLLKASTVAGIAKLMKRLRDSVEVRSSASPLLVALRQGGSRPPLFIVHGALGQAFVSPAFLKAVGEDQPLYGFQA